MAYTVQKLAKCSECDNQTYRRQNVTRIPLCFHCALRHATENMIQQREKSGPYYEKCLARLAGYVATRSRTTPPPPNS